MFQNELPGGGSNHEKTRDVTQRGDDGRQAADEDAAEEGRVRAGEGHAQKPEEKTLANKILNLESKKVK